MTDTNEGLQDDTARARMEAMIAAMRRRAARRVDADADVDMEEDAGAEDERLAAVARQALRQSMPSEAELGASTITEARLGRYLLIEELGRGGMGRVLRAYDPKLQREVALKVLETRSIDSRGWARMVREARAMAKISHPHVVAVYDVEEDPHHGLMIAMELVSGATLREWLQQRPRAWGEALEALIEAGRGLAAAHGQGLLHRDFKPANVLVALGDREGMRGTVKVTDFGLARRDREHGTITGPSTPTEDAAKERLEREGVDEKLTEEGAVVGTPVYMAPEQHRSEPLTPAADQFAFCVALWEALYGERPFGGRTLGEIVDNVLEGRRRVPPKGRVVPVRLRSACERGLSVDPRERWPSMDALLGELQRIVAPRTRRWLALGLTTGLVAVGTGLAVGRYVEVKDRCTGARAQLEGIWDETRRQEVRAAILGTELIHAPATWERVEQRLDGYAEAWVDEHTEICEATSVRRDQSAEVMDLRMECLREHKSELRAVVKVLAGADARVVEKAVEVAAGLPVLASCDDVMRLQRRRERLPPPEDPQVAQEMEVLREQLADIEAAAEAGSYGGALEQVERLVQRAEALGYPVLLAEVRLQRGGLLAEDGHYAEAEQELEAAYALALEHGHDDVTRESAQRLVHVVGEKQEQHGEGRVWAQTALPLAERSGDDVELATSLQGLSGLFFRQGELEQARRCAQQALELMEAALGADHPAVASSLNDLAIALANQGELEQARLHHQRALQLREKALGPNHPEVATSHGNLGVVFNRQGDLERAKLHHQKALEIREKTLGTHHPALASSLNNLGVVLLDHGEYEQARLHFQRALEILEKALGADHPEVAGCLSNLAILFHRQGDYEQSKLHHQRALGILEKALGADHPAVADSLSNLGEILFTLEHYEQAKLYHQRALRIEEKALGADHPRVASSARNLGIVFANQGDYEQAKLYHERALRIWEKALGADHVDLGYGLLGLGGVALSQGEYEQAWLHHERALRIWEKALGAEHPNVAFPLVQLAKVALAQEQLDSARAHAERAVSIREASKAPPLLLAEARFVLARALWADKPQRDRARALAEHARDAFADSGMGGMTKELLLEVQAWLAQHRVR